MGAEQRSDVALIGELGELLRALDETELPLHLYQCASDATARLVDQAKEIARLRAELEEAQTLLKQMRDALAPGESTTWNFLVNTLGVDFADDWHRDLRAANYELEEARALSATLRDQFAMAALTGELASQSSDVGEWLDASSDMLARRCYRIADAMLAARERK